MATTRSEQIAVAGTLPVQSVSGDKRRWVLLVCKGIVSGLLLYWILQGTNFERIFAAIWAAKLPLLLICFSMHFLGMYISARRWRILLAATGTRVPTSRLFQSCLVALFFSNLLPTTIGGDSVRVYDSWRLGRNKRDAITVVFVDRFLGLFVLMLFAVAAVPLAGQLTASLPLLPVWIGLGASGMTLLVFMIFQPTSVAALVPRTRIPILTKLEGLVRKVLSAFEAFQGDTLTLLKALMWSVMLQANVVIFYYLVSRTLGFEVPLTAFFLIVPLSIVIMMMPVSINGIGLRENAFFFFFAMFGITQAQAVAFAWIEFAMLLLLGILGGLVYVVRK